MQIKVDLNGTNENPYRQYGLTQNPFPQIAQHEFAGLCLRLQSLGGEPIKDVEHIRKTLEGFSEEFIDLCVKMFEPRKMVSFTVTFDEKMMKGG